MGVSIPQVITLDRASGSQVVGGSLKFDSASKNHLERDFLSDGNRKTWTWSCWVKKRRARVIWGQLEFGEGHCKEGLIELLTRLCS